MRDKIFYCVAALAVPCATAAAGQPRASAPVQMGSVPPAATAAPPSSPAARAPAPVMRNPNAPQADFGHPDDEQFTGVEFDIDTGADDLRNNAYADAEVDFTDGSKQPCHLKLRDDDSWNNGSQHVVECHLPQPRSYADLRAARIVITKDRYSAWPIWDFDNWNVDAVKVVAKDAVNHFDRCVWRASGNPLIRLTGNVPSFTVEDYDTTC